MNKLKELRLIVKMNERLGVETDQSVFDQILAEEQKEQKQIALAEERKSAFKSLFSDLAKDINAMVAEDKKKTAEEQALLDRFSNVLEKLDGIQTPSVEPQVTITESVEESQQLDEKSAILAPAETPSLAAAAAQRLKDTAAPSMFVQPEPTAVGRDIQAINNKLKLLEGWVSKLSMAGPGGGEVNFRYLDDVNRSTMSSTNDNWVLEYDAASKKVQFTEDVGPVRTVKLNTAGSIISPTAGMIDWNYQEDCMNVYHADGTVWQEGFEDYIQIRNTTGSTITNGTLVQFAGVDENYVPTIAKYVANGSVKPLYVIGICTSDVPAGSVGRATTRGKVRNINTTGSDVGETWARGDLLWAHPTIPGKLTNDQPTSPNIAVSIAAVLRVDATDGMILVRPSIFPRLGNATAHDQITQTAAAINTPYGVKFRTTDLLDGFTINGTNHSIFTSQQHGLFNVRALLQASSTNSSLSNIFVWGRLNGVDIPHSTIRTSIQSNGGAAPVSWQYTISLHPNDTFELMWAVDSTAVTLTAEAAKSFCPETPSCHININQTDL